MNHHQFCKVKEENFGAYNCQLKDVESVYKLREPAVRHRPMETDH